MKIAAFATSFFIGFATGLSLIAPDAYQAPLGKEGYYKNKKAPSDLPPSNLPPSNLQSGRQIRRADVPVRKPF